MNLNKLQELAINTAKEAGDFLNKSKPEKKAVYNEEGRDIKLIIDQDTEKLIRSNLMGTNIPILGEEYGGVISKERYWVIDPIDGTANYYRGLDECCVSIALMEDNEALIGVDINFLAILVVTFKIQSSTPDDVVLVIAIFFSSGDHTKFVIFGFSGRP